MSLDFDDSDPLYSVSCAMSDMKWVVYAAFAALGAVVIAAALALWIVRRA